MFQLTVPEKDVVNISRQQQVNIMAMEDDEFSSGAEDVSSLLLCQLIFIIQSKLVPSVAPCIFVGVLFLSRFIKHM